MTTFEEALALVLETTLALGVEALPLGQAGGRYLARDLSAAHDSPMFDNSAVDGFAVRSSDCASSGARLRVVGSVFAGDDASGFRVGPGECVRTMTGAMVARGADAVVMQEDVALDGETATVNTVVPPGASFRKKGEEYRRGEPLVAAGTRCSPAVLALVASQGLAEVEVGRAPRVSVLTTGSELVGPGLEVAPGQIFESNSVALAEQVRLLTGVAPRVASAGDSVEQIGAVLSDMTAASDLVVVTGGASVGEKDFVRAALRACGVREAFWRIAMKPGKPVSFNVATNGALVFALPGNPVSAQVTFALLVASSVRKMMGAREPGPEFQTATLGSCVRRTGGRKEFLRATTRHERGRLVADPLPHQGSHMSSGIALADRLIVVEPEVECLEAGAAVETVPL